MPLISTVTWCVQYESGGKLFYPVFTRTLVALLLSHITLIGYCVVLGTCSPC